MTKRIVLGDISEDQNGNAVIDTLEGDIKIESGKVVVEVPQQNEWEFRDADVNHNNNDVTNVGALDTGELNSTIQYLGGPGHDSLSDAQDALPSDGGTVRIVETITEPSDVTVDKRLHLVSTGNPYAGHPPTYLDMGGNTLHVTNPRQTWDSVRVENGNVIIGEHDQPAGNNDIELSVRDAPDTGIELRGQSMDCHYVLKSFQSSGDGIVWSLDADDYFNQNVVSVHSHSAGGDGIVMTGPSGDPGPTNPQIHGNTFTGFSSEAAAGIGWRIDNNIYRIAHNTIHGYGVHDGGVDLTPSNGDGNHVVFRILRDGGFWGLGGTVRMSNSDAGNVDFGSGVRREHEGWNRTIDHINDTGNGTSTAYWDIATESEDMWARIGKQDNDNDRFRFRGNGVSAWQFEGAPLEALDGEVTIGGSGAHIYVDSNGDLIAVSEDGSETTLT